MNNRLSRVFHDAACWMRSNQGSFDVNDAVRLAVCPETLKDRWHAVSAGHLDLFEDAYARVIEHYYRQGVSMSERDPLAAALLETLAHEAEFHETVAELGG